MKWKPAQSDQNSAGLAGDLVTVLELDATRQAYKSDPYPIYAELRRSAPVRRITLNGMPAWLATRCDDVRTALSDPNLSNSLDHLNAELAAAGAWVLGERMLVWTATCCAPIRPRTPGYGGW